MKQLITCLLIVLVVPLVGQRSQKEIETIITALQENKILTEEGAKYLALASASQPSLVPTLNAFEVNESNKVFDATLLQNLGIFFEAERMYRMAMDVYLAEVRKIAILPDGTFDSIQMKVIQSSWKEKYREHPGYLIELALGNDLLDTTTQIRDTSTNFLAYGAWSMPTVLPFRAISDKFSVLGPGYEKLLQVLEEKKLIAPEDSQALIEDFQTFGPLSPAVWLKDLARKTGEVETRELRRAETRSVLRDLQQLNLLTTTDYQNILTNDTLLYSSAADKLLPYLNSSVSYQANIYPDLLNGYQTLIRQLAMVNPLFGDLQLILKELLPDKPNEWGFSPIEIELYDGTTRMKDTIYGKIQLDPELGISFFEFPHLELINHYLQEQQSHLQLFFRVSHPVDDSTFLPVTLLLANQEQASYLKEGHRFLEFRPATEDDY